MLYRNSPNYYYSTTTNLIWLKQEQWGGSQTSVWSTLASLLSPSKMLNPNVSLEWRKKRSRSQVSCSRSLSQLVKIWEQKSSLTLLLFGSIAHAITITIPSPETWLIAICSQYSLISPLTHSHLQNLRFCILCSSPLYNRLLWLSTAYKIKPQSFWLYFRLFVICAFSYIVPQFKVTMLASVVSSLICESPPSLSFTWNPGFSSNLSFKVQIKILEACSNYTSPQLLFCLSKDGLYFVSVLAFKFHMDKNRYCLISKR